MKIVYSLLLVAIMSAGVACSSNKKTLSFQPNQQFGKAITADRAQNVSDVVQKMEQQKLKEMPAKITGKVQAVCQAKGCWMTLENKGSTDMRVKFKDYAFFMPKDLAGHTVVAEGIAKLDTVSVAMLRHYAEDAGKSAAEIEAINTPEINVSFMADGVIIVK